MSYLSNSIFWLPWLLCIFARVSSAYKLSNIPHNATENVSDGVEKLEELLDKAMAGDMKELDHLPDPEEKGEEGAQDAGGGELGKSLEFLMLKVAQLETLAELQQTELGMQQEELATQRALIEKLQKKVDPEEAEVSVAQEQKMKGSEERVQEAHDLLKRVVQKHARQRADKEYHPEAHKRKPKKPKHEEVEEGVASESGSLLQEEHRDAGLLGPFKKAWDAGTGAIEGFTDEVSSQIHSAVESLDGTGLTGGALTEAYKRAKEAGDAAKFVAKTKIATLEMAVSILTGGFGDWSGSCTTNLPSVGMSGGEFFVDFGHNKCSISLMNQEAKLFDWNFGRHAVSLNKMIEQIPPLSYLTRMTDILTEVIEVFAKVAGTVVQRAMERSTSLVQTAATAKFPAIGEVPVTHHKSSNLLIESHTRHAPVQQMAAIQTDARDSEAGDDGTITYKMGNSNDVHASKLLTQFNGRETDTSSCLAFAPKNKNADGSVNKEHWQVAHDKNPPFLQLEPYAVPCDNTWMKDHWDKWQGYTFYTQPSAIEKCVTVTFSLGMQPVVAFVGGLQFEILPKPLFELATTVCWPNQQPGGVDLSVLRSEVKSAGIVLFSRTLRLTKRFGEGTDFTSWNYKGGFSTWRTDVGIATGETRVPNDRLSRTRFFLETNQSHSRQSQGQGHQEEESDSNSEDEAETVWKTESENLYLASVDYGVDLNTSLKKTFEAYGEEAAMHMGTEKLGKDVFKLFSFRNPGLVNFKVEGLMNGNILEMGLEMAFGPYSSPSRRIPLVDIAHQFSIILSGIPFVSSQSKLKAIAALNDFSGKDMGKTRGLPLKPGSMIAVYSPHCRRFLQMHANVHLATTEEMNGHGIPDSWTWERFTVVDAGNGEIALHNAFFNRFVKIDGVSDHKNVHELPHDWTSERFKVVEVGNGEMAFYNPTQNRFLLMGANRVGHSNHPPNPPKLPSDWGWERFRVVAAERILVPGTSVALHNQLFNRFAQMHGGNMERSPEKAAVEFPEYWTWERFTVVDAGHGQIALHNTLHNRFVKVGGASGHKLVDQLPADWVSERWDVWPAGNGQIVLHNRHHNQLLRMSDHTVDDSAQMDPKNLPDNWGWERWQVVHVKPYLQPGTTVALRCPFHGRYVMMYPGAPQALLLEKESHTQTQNHTLNLPGGFFRDMTSRFTMPSFSFDPLGLKRKAEEERQRRAQELAEEAARQAALRGTIGRSAHQDAHGVPDFWTYERFTVIDAGNGQVAFHNSLHNRYLKMDGERMLVSSPMAPDAYPSDWSWERFTVLPAGNGEFMFHNSVHNRVIRMTDDGSNKVDSSSHMDPQNIPEHWPWESFQIVPVRPYLQPGTVVALHCAVHNRYITMNGDSVQRSAERNLNDLPPNWSWERFTVVDAGNGQVAFHNAVHGRFLQMKGETIGGSKPYRISDLGSDWTWDRFTVVPSDHGQFVFHNTFHNRMIRMTDHTVDSSSHMAPQDLPVEWTSERFRIVTITDVRESSHVHATFD
ncbi:unnamed protein product [Symbiodinium sp. CCMP2592]|nr:unnamed protein product [Symbiodinium sp. CCMP2592]